MIKVKGNIATFDGDDLKFLKRIQKEAGYKTLQETFTEMINHALYEMETGSTNIEWKHTKKENKKSKEVK